MKSICSVIAGRAGIAMAAALALSLSAKADTLPNEALLGSWTFDSEKSNFTPGPSPYRSLMMTFSATDKGVKNDAVGIGADGQPVEAEYTIILDGKYYPVTGLSTFDSSSYTRVNDRTTVYVRRRSGNSVVAGSRLLSSDGKTLTFREKTFDSEGRETGKAMLVFEKL